MTSAARRISRPPSVSTSANARSLRTRRSKSPHIHRCTGRIILSRYVARHGGKYLGVTIRDASVPSDDTTVASIWRGARGPGARRQSELARQALPAVVFPAPPLVRDCGGGRPSHDWRTSACGSRSSLRPRIGRFVAGTRSEPFPSPSRAVLAIGAGELVLRTRASARSGGWCPKRSRVVVSDPRLGWTFVPNRTARTPHRRTRRRVCIDPAGYRVRRVDEPVDPERPTILFTGESVMFGEGLTWDESMPARSER